MSMCKNVHMGAGAQEVKMSGLPGIGVPDNCEPPNMEHDSGPLQRQYSMCS